ncbi:MAG: disulfide bond formation protein B [Methylacidiphilales bacterium]|nr:disulfide bond formation protein B [Candidatus Methylacidiphilales bacterium]
MNLFTSIPILQSLVIAFVSFFGFIFAIFLQITAGYLPCPLCIMQRYSYGVIFLLALCAIYWYQNTKVKIMHFFLLLVSLISVCIALAHLYIRYGKAPSQECIADPLELALNSFWFAKWFPTMFSSLGSCVDISPPILGLDIIIWSALGSGTMLVFSVFLFIKK